MNTSPQYNLVEKACTLSLFSDVLDSIRIVDTAMAENIKSTLLATLGHLPATLADSMAPAYEKIIALKDAKLRLMEYRLHYEMIEEQMARQREHFLRTAMDTSSAFFDEVYNNLDAYFMELGDKVAEFLCNKSSWWTGLVDTWKKTGGVTINKTKTTVHRMAINATGPRLVDNVSNFIGPRFKNTLQPLIDSTEKIHAKLENTDANAVVVEDRILLEEALDKLCPNDAIEQKVAHIFEQAVVRYQATWKKRVAAYHQELSKMDGAVRAAVGAFSVSPEFTLGLAEQTLAASLSATIFGTAVLAAGWHTLAFAMINVFWPLTVFVVILTSGVAWFTKDRASEQRIVESKKILNAYHAQLLLFIDTKPLEENGTKSIRQLVNEHSLAVASEQDAVWTRVLYGRLESRHYTELAKAIRQQLALLDELEREVM